MERLNNLLKVIQVVSDETSVRSQVDLVPKVLKKNSKVTGYIPWSQLENIFQITPEQKQCCLVCCGGCSI